MFLNNVDGFFLYDESWASAMFESLASLYCHPGTKIVSLGPPMFFTIKCGIAGLLILQPVNLTCLGWATQGKLISMCTLKCTGK